MALKIPFYDYFATRYYLSDTGAQRRRESRMKHLKKCNAVISDGIHTCSGLVENFSRMGLCIIGIPNAIPISEQHLSVRIEQGGSTITLSALPRWMNVEEGRGWRVGMHITDANPVWNDFVRSR